MDKGLKILKRPLMSEKSTAQGEALGRFYFEVGRDATKPQIRQAVEQFFKVTVTDVNTMVMPGKGYSTKIQYKKRPRWKKAAVTLKEGDKIEFFKGV